MRMYCRAYASYFKRMIRRGLGAEYLMLRPFKQLIMQTVDLIVSTQIHCLRGNFLMGTLIYFQVTQPGKGKLTQTNTHFTQFFPLAMHNIL